MSVRYRVTYLVLNVRVDEQRVRLGMNVLHHHLEAIEAVDSVCEEARR
jgi:hypothetical protein